MRNHEQLAAELKELRTHVRMLRHGMPQLHVDQLRMRVELLQIEVALGQSMPVAPEGDRTQMPPGYEEHWSADGVVHWWEKRGDREFSSTEEVRADAWRDHDASNAAARAEIARLRTLVANLAVDGVGEADKDRLERYRSALVQISATNTRQPLIFARRILDGMPVVEALAAER